MIETLQREAVRLPTLGAAQEAAWHVLLDLDELHDEPWVLIGGQITMIHCLENGIDTYRTTDDGDVVLGGVDSAGCAEDDEPLPAGPRVPGGADPRSLRISLRPG